MIQTAQALVAAAERSKLHLLQSGTLLYWAGTLPARRTGLPPGRALPACLTSRYTCNVGALRDGVQRLALLHQLADEQDEAC